MKSGNDEFTTTVNKCEGMAHWYEERDPALAEYLYKLIRYTKALDKNQKALIKRLLKGLRREKKLKAMINKLKEVADLDC